MRAWWIPNMLYDSKMHGIMHHMDLNYSRHKETLLKQMNLMQHATHPYKDMDKIFHLSRVLYRVFTLLIKNHSSTVQRFGGVP